MADRKITDLTALAAGSQATGDLLTIVDVSESAAADKNKKITVENLFKGIPGDVGIGTSSPVANTPLTLQGPSGYTDTLWLKSIGTNIDSRINFGPTGTGDAQINNATGTDIAFQVSGSEKLRIDSSGNVGIGTSSPSYLLDLSTSNDAPVHINSTNANGPHIRLAASGTVKHYFGSGGGFSLGDADDFAIRSADNIIFSTNGNSTENARIDSSGRLLVGTTTAGDAGADNLTIADSGAAGITIRSGSSTSAAIYFADGTSGSQNYQGIVQYVHSGDELQFYTNYGANSNPGMRIDSSGNVGIGTTPNDVDSIGRALNIASSTGGAIYLQDTDSLTGKFAAISYNGSTTGLQIHAHHSSSFIDFGTNGTERMRIDSSGRLLVGTSTARSNFFAAVASAVQVEGNDTPTSTISVVRNSNNADGPTVLLGRSRGTGNTIVQNGDRIGRIEFQANDGSNFLSVANIQAFVDGNPGASDMPSRLTFATCADGASSPTERMRINSSGSVMFGTTNELPSANSTAGAAFYRGEGHLELCRGGDMLSLNRINTDGPLVYFRQGGVTEGSISVAGTTVSYNGAHLSRWSQLAGNAERTEILRGSVLSNLDEMCEWGDEDNEQLNRMKVSDVEGDVNVSGVFQAWDDDDDTYTNDFYCAMTGDFVIRVAQGTTVARGDLLMSAGDGTAKPQDDDIVRSKTIAKVTSTTVSTTYADGSYCVPCVLMAC